MKPTTKTKKYAVFLIIFFAFFCFVNHVYPVADRKKIWRLKFSGLALCIFSIFIFFASAHGASASTPAVYYFVGQSFPLKKQKIRFYTDFLTNTNLVQDSGLSSTGNTTKLYEICQIEFYPQGCGGTGNRTPGFMDDRPEPAPSSPHNDNIITQK